MLIQVQEAHSKQDEKINSHITLQLKIQNKERVLKTAKRRKPHYIERQDHQLIFQQKPKKTERLGKIYFKFRKHTTSNNYFQQ
jgi:oligoendopeptidase F